MKRRLYVIACICLSLVTVLSSCSLDDLEGNVYERMGMVKFDNPAVNDVSNRIDNMETAPVEDAFEGQKLDLSKVDGFKEIYETIQNIGGDGAIGADGLKIELETDAVNIIKANGLLKPQENKNDLYTSISESLNAKKDFVASMSEPAGKTQSDAAKGTMALTNSLIKTLTDNMNTEDGDMPEEVKTILTDLQKELEDKSKKTEDLTKAEVLQVQMITNLVSSAANLSSVIKAEEDEKPGDETGDDDEFDFTSPEAMEVMNDVLLLSQVTGAVSGSIDVLDIPDLSGLINQFLNSGTGN